MAKRVVLKIIGHVQGVFFRTFVKEKAEELGLAGWVKNAADGTVEILAVGDEENLNKLVASCKEGPKFAKVEKVMVKWDKTQGKIADFKIL